MSLPIEDEAVIVRNSIDAVFGGNPEYFTMPSIL